MSIGIGYQQIKNYQKIFIREFKDKVKWDEIYQCIKIYTENFITQFPK